MTKILITNKDGLDVEIDIDMEKLWSLAQTFISGTKISIPAGYFSDVGAVITIE